VTFSLRYFAIGTVLAVLTAGVLAWTTGFSLWAAVVIAVIVALGSNFVER
jgi:hypothetical protein